MKIILNILLKFNNNSHNIDLILKFIYYILKKQTLISKK